MLRATWRGLETWHGRDTSANWRASPRPYREGRSSSRRLRSGSRSARKGSRDRNASAAWQLGGLPPKRSSGNKRALWGISIRRDSVIPLAVELGALDIDCGHLGVGDDNAAGVLASVEFAAHGEAGFGGGGRD